MPKENIKTKEHIRIKELKEGEIIPITFDFMFQAIFKRKIT